METNTEGVATIYQDKKLIAIVKRDEHTKKHLVYMVHEATTEDIVNLINHKV